MVNMVKLGDVCTVVSGSTPKTNVDEYWNGNIKWITPAELDSDSLYIYDTVKHISELGRTKTGLSYMPEGTVILSSRAPIGKTAIAGCEMCCNQGFKNLICSDRVLNKYLFYFLKSKTEFLNSLGRGATFKELSKSIVENIEIPLPSIEEQIKISEKFICVDNQLDLRKQQLSKLDELVKSRFIELFGDPNIEFKYQSYKFKEFAIDMTKGPFGSDMKKELFVPKGKDTYKVYIQANAIQGNQDIGDYYISKEYFDSKIFKFEVHPGDYIITCDGTLGKHLKLNDKMERGVISPSLLRLTLNEDKMTKEYFEYIWDMYILLLMKKEARNACLVHLPSAKVIGEIDIPVPPINLQKEFATFVEQTDKLKFDSHNILKKLQNLIKIITRRCFYDQL